ncbi:MAG: hypothetical protein U0518_04630 [Candidatus Gracilibacteria bacterium]
MEHIICTQALPQSIDSYRHYFGNLRYMRLVASHFLRGHTISQLLFTLEHEYLEDNATWF